MHASEAPSSSAARVAILICTFRGERYLRRQLETIVEQTHTDWFICASDDGSDDNTLAILREFQQRLGDARLRIFAGPRNGFAANFLALIARADIQAPYYAFTDQDDEWDAHKLARAVAALGARPSGRPALYGSRAELIGPDGRHLGFSRIFSKPPGFSNALVQNMVTGNTMVLNQPALQLMRDVGADLHVSAHDWWAYLLITGSGGDMIYDTYPTIRYRQHGANLYGENVSWRARWSRATRLFKGEFRAWNTLNVAALRRCAHLLTAQSRSRLELFDAARRASSLSRLVYVIRSGVYRQTWDGQLALLLAALTKRL